MFVLHCHWQPAAQHTTPALFLFWAETSEAPQPAQQSPRKRKVPAHPFAATATSVRSLLETLAACSGLSVVINTQHAIELHLPSSLSRPKVFRGWEQTKKSPMGAEQTKKS